MKRRPPALCALVALVAAAGLAGPTARCVADADGVAFESSDLSMDQLLTKAKPDHLVLIDLSTTSCSWCKVLERETLSKPVVAAATRSMVCVQYDAAAGPGRDLVHRFAVRSYPTVLVLDDRGEEVDRIIGFRPPDRFVKELERIQSGEGTLRSARLAHEKDPASPTAAVTYAHKLTATGDVGKARALLDPIVTLSPKTTDAKPVDAEAQAAAMVGLAELEAELSNARKALEWATRVTTEHADAEAAPHAWLLRVELHATLGELDEALADAVAARDRVKRDADVVALAEATFRLHRARSEAALVRWGERALAAKDFEALADAAQAAFQSRLVLGAAVRWAEAAAEGSARQPAALLTWAEVLAETGSPEKALALAREVEGRLEAEDARDRLSALLARLKAPSEPPSPASPAPPKAPDGAKPSSPAESPPAEPCPQPEGKPPAPPTSASAGECVPSSR